MHSGDRTAVTLHKSLESLLKGRVTLEPTALQTAHKCLQAVPQLGEQNTIGSVTTPLQKTRSGQHNCGMVRGRDGWNDN